MYPSENQRLKKETIGSYSKAVIGILIVTMTITFGILILGVWGSDNTKNGVQQNDNETPFILENNPSEKKILEEYSSEKKISDEDSSEIKITAVISSEISISEESPSGAIISGSSDVSVPEGTGIYNLDTVPGEIIIISENLPQDPLPLKITDGWLSQYGVTVEVIGGYEYIGGMILVKQGEDAKEECKGKIEIIASQPYGHGLKMYDLTFVLPDGAHPIILDSNELPIVPAGWNVFPDKTLEKEVDLCIITKWSGCELESQEFMVILTHKAKSQNPQLSIRVTSPVLK